MRYLYVLSLAFLLGCGGGSEEFVETRDMTAVDTAANRQAIIGHAETIAGMIKAGEDPKPFIEEQLPSFENYAALEGDPNQATYAKILELWKQLQSAGSSEVSDLLKQVREAAKEIQ